MLCVAQMGWLHAVPKAPDKGKLKGATKRLSRLERMKKGGNVPHMPPVHLGESELEHFMNVGPARFAGTGTEAIQFTEIEAYSRTCGVNLQPWQCQLLRTLSQHYVHNLVLSEDPQTPAPYVDTQQVKRDAVSTRLSTLLRGMARKGVKK